MFSNRIIIFVSLLVNVIVGYSDLEEGDACEPTLDISEGICILVTDCDDAMRYIRRREPHPFERCGWLRGSGSMEIVCCPRKSTVAPTRPTKKPATPVPADRSGVNGRIADKKCKEIVNNSIPPLGLHIIGGEDAQLGEFPYMVALGYLKEGAYDFSCGGTLISEYYILTAAHCVDNVEQITPNIARMGVIEIGKNEFNPGTDIRIADVISHPTRTSLHKYHDIALLRLSEAAQYSANVVPACLHTAPTVPAVPLTVTGWGKISVTKDIRSKILQKANVTEVARSECQKGYSNWRKLPDGIGAGQLCAGDPQGRTDSCQGDSGGPLQALTSEDGHYRVIGVTSFGRGCGSSTPGVYTRVFTYLDWIESVVWPNGA